jgi:hypothetical protein
MSLGPHPSQLLPPLPGLSPLTPPSPDGTRKLSLFDAARCFSRRLDSGLQLPDAGSGNSRASTRKPSLFDAILRFNNAPAPASWVELPPDPDLLQAFAEIGGRSDGTGEVPLTNVVAALACFGLRVDDKGVVHQEDQVPEGRRRSLCFVARAKSGVDWPTFQRIFMQVCPPVRDAYSIPSLGLPDDKRRRGSRLETIRVDTQPSGTSGPPIADGSPRPSILQKPDNRQVPAWKGAACLAWDLNPTQEPSSPNMSPRSMLSLSMSTRSDAAAHWRKSGRACDAAEAGAQGGLRAHAELTTRLDHIIGRHRQTLLRAKDSPPPEALVQRLIENHAAARRLRPGHSQSSSSSSSSPRAQRVIVGDNLRGAASLRQA